MNNMTREAMIAKEARSLAAFVYTNENIHNAIYDALLTMADYVDSHPMNPWRIFPKDIPNDGQEVILTWKKSGVILKALFQKEFVTTRGKLVKNIFRLEHEEYKGLYSNIRWHDESSVTFWMPIPSLPKGKEK